MISSKKLFIKFLKENHAYGQYMFNLNSKKGKLFTPKNFFLNTFYGDFVTNAFYWKNTSQGYDYWNELEDKWWNNLRTKGLI